jgi:hypothetical protein
MQLVICNAVKKSVISIFLPAPQDDKMDFKYQNIYFENNQKHLRHTYIRISNFSFFGIVHLAKVLVYLIYGRLLFIPTY